MFSPPSGATPGPSLIGATPVSSPSGATSGRSPIGATPMSSPAEASSWHSPDSAISGGACKTASSKDSSNVVSKYLQVPVDSTPRRAERSLPRAKLLTSLDSLRILEEKGKKSRKNWK